MDFNKLAKDFDTDLRRQKAHIIAERIRPYTSGKSAMEFGCGTGLLGMELLDEFDEMTFIDSSPVMIEEVKKKIHQRPGASTISMDLTKEPLEKIHFGFIFTSMALHHILDTEDILRKLYNLLNNEGTLVIIDMDKNNQSFHGNDFKGHEGFDRNELKDLLASLGYRNIEIETLTRGEKKIGNDSITFSQFILKAIK